MLGGDDGHLCQVGVGGSPCARIDQVVRLPGPDSPPAAIRCAGGNGAIAHAQRQDDAGGVEGILDLDDPAGAIGSVAAGERIAAGVDDARHGNERSREVDGAALHEPAEIDLEVRRATHGAGRLIEHDVEDAQRPRTVPGPLPVQRAW